MPQPENTRPVCVYCGSENGLGEAYCAAARSLGDYLATRKIPLVYGGARIGLMGVVADTVLARGGTAIGVMPKALVDRVAHRALSELIIVESMHERKLKMFELSGAFIAMPGGFGTLDEMFELLAWTQLGIHSKPCGFLNVNGYFSTLLDFLDNCVSEGFVRENHRAFVYSATTPEQLFHAFSNHGAPLVKQWLREARWSESEKLRERPAS